MKSTSYTVNRRTFLAGSAAGVAAATIVPRNVLGQGVDPPSEEFGAALIGCGGRGGGTFRDLSTRHHLNVRMLAKCDVQINRLGGEPDNKNRYTDYRRLLERKDIEIVAIATPPGWHALISIAAMEAGKDVLCEKPMTRTIAEGRAVAEAEKRFGRVYQIGTYGRFGRSRSKRKIFLSGLLDRCDTVVVQRGGKKVAQWSGRVRYDVPQVPKSLVWDMYCGPTPLRPYNPHRVGGTHRGYWDHEGGGLADMAHHQLDGPAFEFARDVTAPVEIIPYAPPQHPEAVGMWGWCEMKYADGFTLVLDSGEWGKPYDRLKQQKTSTDEILAMVPEENRAQVKALPLPEAPLGFGDAVKQRKPAGGNAQVSHRVATIYHLANIAFRVGRPIQFDPDKEVIVGDEEANRLIDQPMRAPWRL